MEDSWHVTYEKPLIHVEAIPTDGEWFGHVWIGGKPALKLGPFKASAQARDAVYARIIDRFTALLNSEGSL